uniref:Uncharacterized protein n=1 Tax=uncultured Armatimonadetes bacterium TaxID=157466 RepID=A0A6J4J759_9BACT|nr:hypothetical protein AVDCRST_MAG63-2825 [uncultured Armatimonadetes bacterium]
MDEPGITDLHGDQTPAGGRETVEDDFAGVGHVKPFAKGSDCRHYKRGAAYCATACRSGFQTGRRRLSVTGRPFRWHKKAIKSTAARGTTQVPDS